MVINMIDKTCCFTGHRKIDPKQYELVSKRLDMILEDLIASGYCYFGVGGALGFDTMAAQAVLKLKGKYSQIKLILVLPCLSQADAWSKNDQRIYEEIRSRADKIVYISQEYTKECMLRRNRHLVDNSSVCICYLTKSVGGTAYTVNYAIQKGVKIINLA